MNVSQKEQSAAAGTQLRNRQGSRRPDFRGLVARWPNASFRASQCRKRISALQKMELSFIHNREFDALTWTELDEAARADGVYQQSGPHERRSGEQQIRELPAYLAGLYETHLLTADGEVALFRLMNYLKYWANAMRSRLNCSSRKADLDTVEALVKESDRVRNLIAQANLRLVVSIARKFANSRQEFEELVSEGNMILIKAVDKFDYSRGFRFSTYTTHAVQRHFYRRWQSQQKRRQRLQLAPQEVLSEVEHQVADRSFDPEPVREIQKLVEHMGEFLDERERHIVIERFGLGRSGSGRTLRQIAEDLGISKERVRQLQFKAIDKLKEMATVFGVSLTPA